MIYSEQAESFGVVCYQAFCSENHYKFSVNVREWILHGMTQAMTKLK